MSIENTKSILNYDGQITFGKGTVLLRLPEDLHNWIMENVQSKHKRAEFIRAKLRLLMEGQDFIFSQNQTQKRRYKTLDEIKQDIRAKKQSKKLGKKEKKELEIQEALVGINEELKNLFARKASISS
ncbi:MAG: hypothetical protein ACTSW1_19855 [Candidatus Hodarchaeales archaeon]